MRLCIIKSSSCLFSVWCFVDLFDEERQALENELEAKIEELDESEDQLLALLDEQNEYEDTISTLEEEVNSLRNQVSDLRQQLDSAQSENSAQRRTKRDDRTASMGSSDESSVTQSPIQKPGDERSRNKKSKNKKGPIDNSQEAWSEMQGWVRFDDHKRYARLSRLSFQLYKRDAADSRATQTIDLREVEDCQYLDEFLQLTYKGEAVDIVLKEEQDAAAWSGAISRNIALI